jgi:GPH family glycoside/pentoside/hexuronide:cation symporter
MGVAGMVFGLAGLASFGGIARRWGKRNGLAAVLATAIAAFIGDWFFYDPAHPALQLLATGFVAFTGAGFWTLYSSALADVVDHDELHTGQRREGSFSACQSWISKLGLAVGGGASGWILQLTGFDSKLAVQNDQVILVIRTLLSGIPATGLALALFMVFRFRLDGARMTEIRLALEGRRGQV